MILEISKHIILDENHPKLPDWIFHRDNIILAQQIELNEVHMREFLIFLNYYSSNFSLCDLNVSVVEFEDIKLRC